MARSQTTDSSAHDDVPNDPTDLSAWSWLAAARRALKEYKADDLQDRAAALTYFGIQSILPGLLVPVSLLGVLGKSATQPLITNLGKAAPSSVRKIIISDVVEQGADLPGVPAGDQTPKNPGAAPAQEMGGGVGLALPGDPARKKEQAGPEGHRP
jgi:hypothetical protein